MLLRNVPEGRCDRSLARSAWDSATPKEPSRRVRCDSRRFGHRFDDWSDEISNSKTEKRFVVWFLAYDTISFHGKHFLVPEHSWRFQHEGTCLNPDLRERLWPYLGGIAKQNGMIPKCIGGVSDHVPLLVTLPTRLAVAKAVQLIKAGSSAWIHQTFPNLRNFAWQQGYGAFSVGVSQVQETVHYIEQQLEHHRTRTFQEEYLVFLKKHGAHFDEKYLWD